MTRVEVKGDLNNAIKRWKVKLSKSGVPSELKRHKHYTKPGVEKREAQQEMEKNFRKRNRRK